MWVRFPPGTPVLTAVRCTAIFEWAFALDYRLLSRNDFGAPVLPRHMPAEVKKEIELEIAHVLFTDIVGYSKLPINQQRALVERLNEIVRGTDEFHIAEKAGRLLTIPTGDGITLVFYHTPEAPVECALEISRALKKHPELQLRMGV